jgi:hypothetical protein
MKRRVSLDLLAAISLLALLAGALELRHPRAQSLPPASSKHQIKPEFVLLPGSEAKALARLFDASAGPVESWEPTVADINGLEDNLSQIRAMHETRGANRHIESPDQYFRQYLAIVVGERKLIYVNAVCSVDARALSVWRKKLFIAYDGGACYWQATYDPAAKQFFDLTINGVA